MNEKKKVNMVGTRMEKIYLNEVNRINEMVLRDPWDIGFLEQCMIDENCFFYVAMVVDRIKINTGPGCIDSGNKYTSNNKIAGYVIFSQNPNGGLLGEETEDLGNDCICRCPQECDGECDCDCDRCMEISMDCGEYPDQSKSYGSKSDNFCDIQREIDVLVVDHEFRNLGVGEFLLNLASDKNAEDSDIPMIVSVPDDCLSMHMMLKKNRWRCVDISEDYKNYLFVEEN